MGVVGTIGDGKLLVLYPAFRGVPQATDFAFGIQRTIARRLKACGRTSMFCVFRTRVDAVHFDGEGPPPLKVGDCVGLGFVDAWPDDAATQIVVRQFACRWGVVFEMEAEDSRTRLDMRLLEANEDGGARVIATRHWDDENVGIPGEVFAIVQEVAMRTGTRCPWTSWPAMFETDDALAVMFGLRLTGVVSGVEEGVPYERDPLLAQMHDMVVRAPGSTWVTDLVGEMLRGLHRQKVSPLHLVAWLRRAEKIVSAWPGLAEELERPVE